MTISYHRYVQHHRVPDYEACGWKYESSLEGTTHGHWSVLMTYVGMDDPPKEPPKEELTKEGK
jgi:hypothetical protein